MTLHPKILSLRWEYWVFQRQKREPTKIENLGFIHFPNVFFTILVKNGSGRKEPLRQPLAKMNENPCVKTTTVS